MKRFSGLFILSLILFLGAGKGFAQKGPIIGVMGGPQSTWMFNSQDSEEGDQLDYQPTFGSSYGVRVGFFFTDNVGLEAGYIISSQGQKYQHVYEIAGEDEEFFSQRMVTYNKIPVLLHLRSNPNETAYFSVILGPQFSLLSSYGYTADDVGGFGGVAANWGEEEDHAEQTTDVVLGFGPGFSISDNLKIDLHFRFDYSFTDAENKDSKHWENWPIYEFDDRTAATHNATGGLQIGATYTFGM